MLKRLLRPWWGVALVVAGLSLFCSAGTWQLNRAAEKRELFAAFAAGGTEEPWSALLDDADAARNRYLRLRLEGRFDPEHQVLLDNMPEEGRPGYHVLTPFVTSAGTVMVNRGWVPAPGDRNVLPPVPVDDGPRTVTGRIDRFPRPGLALDAPLPSSAAPWPRRLFFPDGPTIAAQLGHPVRDYQLLLDPDEPDGFRRQWKPAEFGPERHLGYAVQWFGLAATVLVIWLVLALRRSREIVP